MVDPDDALGIAMNPLRDDVVRLASWREYEAVMWTTAVQNRGLHLDLVPPEYYRRVRDNLRILEATEPKTLVQLNP